MTEYILGKNGFYMVSAGHNGRFPLWQVNPEKAIRYPTLDAAEQAKLLIGGHVQIISVPKESDNAD